MKLKNLFNLLVLGSALTITAVGCKHPQGLTPLPGHKTAVLDPNGVGNGRPINDGNAIGSNPGNGTGAFTPPNGANHAGWAEDPSMPLKSQTVYFDFDKSSVKSSEQAKLEEVASYLKSHGDVALRVEGNCDERGTEEYNRALGERRALAAREYLLQLGIEASRVDTITYGEDKPAETGHSEAAWAKNRRDEFVVLLAPKP